MAMGLACPPGTCAAMALASGVGPADVPVADLQQRLRADGVYLEDVPAGV